MCACRKRRCGTTVVAVVAAVVALAFSAATASASSLSLGQPTSAGFVRPWAAEHLDNVRSRTEVEALNLAQHFDVVESQSRTVTPYVSEMHAANPNLELFAYMNGTWTWDTTLGEACYSHDGFGRRISAISWPFTF